MSDNFISNVLNILRLAKDPELQGNQTINYINKWAGGELPEAAALRVCAYVQDQCDGALSLINQSRLPDEAKAGLNQTVQALKNAFSLGQLQTQLVSHLPQLDASISSFAILEGVSNLAGSTPDVPELAELILEIEQIVALFDDAEIDPVVRATAKKHLSLLLALLKNVEAFGVDAAMAAYAELLIRLRRVDATASETARSKTAKAWPTIEKWLGRLAIIEKAYNSGQGLLEQAHGLGQILLKHIN